MTLQEQSQKERTVQTSIAALSGSRRRSGNTKFLVTKALEATVAYADEVNSQLQSRSATFNVGVSADVFETYFDDRDEVIDSVRNSRVLLLGSPVYFGSISPNLNEVMQQVSARSDIDLTTKAAGCIVVGTQRNGGQETAIEDMWRWFLDRNITFLGNGPVTTQYGGTAWGGAKMSTQRDIYGISTTMGTGKRLVQDSIIRTTGLTFISSLLSHDPAKSKLFAELTEVPKLDNDMIGHIASKIIPKTRFLFFTDTIEVGANAKEIMKGIWSGYDELIQTVDFSSVQDPQPEIDMMSLEKDLRVVKDCAACAICPPGNEKIPGVYGCIYNDDLNSNFHRFYDASSIICSTQDKYGLTPPKYWLVLNRMRSVRRNDYMLSGRMGSVVYQSTPGTQIPLKWLIRNNLSILSSSRDNSFEFGKSLFRETFLRDLGKSAFKYFGVNIWTPPVHHE